MKFFYVKQVMNRWGMTSKFLSKGNQLVDVFSFETIKEITNQQNANSIALKSEKVFGGHFEVWFYNGIEHRRTAFNSCSHLYAASNALDIESRLRHGKRVSTSDLNRFLRTSRGQIFFSNRYGNVV